MLMKKVFNNVEDQKKCMTRMNKELVGHTEDGTVYVRISKLDFIKRNNLKLFGFEEV